MIQTDKKLEHNKPEIVVVNKETNACLIIDVASPFDTRVIEKEREKITRYEDLMWEIIKIWKCRSVRVIPIVIGALGTISKITCPQLARTYTLVPSRKHVYSEQHVLFDTL